MPRNQVTQPPEPNIEEKVLFLSDARAYAHAPKSVRVVETHMSWVFLADDLVFKLKKPVARDLIDFSSLARRRRAVHDEARLNRRLAPEIYATPRPLRLGPDGALSLGDRGKIVDWLVVMRRLPDSLSLEERIRDGRLAPEDVDAVADTLARFYKGQPAEDVDPQRYVRGFEVSHRTTRAALADPRLAMDGPRLEGVLSAFEARLEHMRPVLRERVRQRRIVEGHGDLRPQHVFLTHPPVIIDCLEFSRPLRLVDPLDEVAFLGMESTVLGAGWVFERLASRLMDALSDPAPPELAAFYWQYRALLRARLTILHLADPRPRTPEKWRPLAWRYVELAEAADIMTRLPAGR